MNDLFEKNLAVARVQAEGILQPENPTRTGPKFWFAGEVAPPTIRLLALAECLPSRPGPRLWGRKTILESSMRP